MLRTKKVRPDVTERVLDHVIAGIEGTYDGYDYLADKREALKALAGIIDLIVSPPAGNVVPLQRAAG